MEATISARRRFLKWVVGLAGAAAASIAAVPALAAVIFPLRARTIREEDGFVDVGAAADLAGGGEPVRANVLATRYDAWTRVEGVQLGTVWLLRKADGSVGAYSSVCPHLGCSVDFLPESKTFNCPCHGSVFDLEGRVTAGPSPRPLDRLPVEIRDGRVLVKYQRFVVGTATQRSA